MSSRRRVILRHFEAKQTLSPGVCFAPRLCVGFGQSEMDFKVIRLDLQGLFQVLDAISCFARLSETDSTE